MLCVIQFWTSRRRRITRRQLLSQQSAGKWFCLRFSTPRPCHIGAALLESSRSCGSKLRWLRVIMVRPYPGPANVCTHFYLRHVLSLLPSSPPYLLCCPSSAPERLVNNESLSRKHKRSCEKQGSSTASSGAVHIRWLPCLTQPMRANALR